MSGDARPSRPRRVLGSALYALGGAGAILGFLGLQTRAWPGVAPLAAGIALYLPGGRIRTGGWAFLQPFNF